MMKIYRIAQIELRILFYSPVAWFIIIIFNFQAGLEFIELIKGLIESQESVGDLIPKMYGGLTHIIFNWPETGFFPKVQSTLYLYIPLITMGLMSRETSSGSIKLLFSSPIKIRQIVLGKFIAVIVYCVMLVLILFLYLLAANYSIRLMNFGMAFSGLISTFLIVSAYAAIGLFMSSLTSYQVVSAISTMAVFAALQYIGGIGQNISIVRTITYVLSLKNQTINLNNGLISTADVFYFIIIISLFLSLTIMKLNDERVVRPVIVRVGRYVTVITAFILFGYMSSRPDFIKYLDITANKSETLSPESQNVIKMVKEPIKVTSFTNLLGSHVNIGLSENRNSDYRFWEPFRRFMPNMELSYIYYYDTSNNYTFTLKENVGLTTRQIANKTADSYGYNISMFLTPEEIKKQINLAPEAFRFVRQIKMGAHATFLRVFDDIYLNGQPLENEITAAIKRLVQTPPKIFFLKGHSERSVMLEDPDQISLFSNTLSQRKALINQGFDVDTTSLERDENHDVNSTLVIVDPKTKFIGLEEQRIKLYLEKGGNMMIAVDTGSSDILKPLLKELGVCLIKGVLIQHEKGFSSSRVKARISDSANKYLDVEKLKDIGSGNLMKITMNGVFGLKPEGSGTFSIKPLLVASNNKIPSEIIPTALILTRRLNGREQRIIVTGDADFMSNQYWEDNDPFILETFKWLCYGSFPIDSQIKFYDTSFSAKLSDVFIIRMIFLVFMPGIMMIYSSVLLIRRRKQ
jgi:ABC-2 type transport system permease protein